ncbi:hypothetical protein PFISCL1PPCAC_9152, partial [Pristionchus fissidentatus]
KNWRLLEYYVIINVAWRVFEIGIGLCGCGVVGSKIKSITEAHDYYMFLFFPAVILLYMTLRSIYYLVNRKINRGSGKYERFQAERIREEYLSRGVQRPEHSLFPLFRYLRRFHTNYRWIDRPRIFQFTGLGYNHRVLPYHTSPVSVLSHSYTVE